MHLIVTGADGALGAAVIERLALAGARMAAVGGWEGEEDAGRGRFAAGDLADEANARAVVAKAAEWLEQVDGLIHLAGAFQWVETAASTLADWRAQFDANLATAVATATAVLPHMAVGGSIVLVGATSAQPAGAGFGPYGAAKAGVARLVEALAIEQAPRGIRVNAVLPAIIDTPRNRADMPDADPTRWTSPAAIADAIVFLASPAAQAVTGALLPVTNSSSPCLNKPQPDPDLAQALEELPRWTLEENGDALRRRLRFDDFAAALAAMVRIGIDADKADHHPEWSNVYDTVDIRLTTHDAGGVTERDLALARAIDDIYPTA